MPYIKKNDREEFINYPDDRAICNGGELNYRITLLIKDYMRHKGKSYETFNDILGALEGSKLEFYRRIVSPYEDKKIIENGDVY